MKPNLHPTQFGASLRRLRKSAGLSQRGFAKLVGLDQAHLSKLERGERLPSWRTMRRLARAFPEDIRNLLLSPRT